MKQVDIPEVASAQEPSKYRAIVDELVSAHSKGKAIEIDDETWKKWILFSSLGQYLKKMTSNERGHSVYRLRRKAIGSRVMWLERRNSVHLMSTTIAEDIETK